MGIERGLERLLDKKIEPIRTKCPKCSGTGYVDNVECKSCNGTGQTKQQ
jgi:DnaJ-class molecular chaperone